MTRPLRIAWLTTARGPGSYGAFEHVAHAIEDGLPASIAAVFVNRDPGESDATDRFFDLVRKTGSPLETLSSVRFRKERGGSRSLPGEPLPAWRLEYDAEVARRLREHEFDLAVMFGYMLIATEPLFGAFPVINDHPALPDGPVGTYQQVIAELIRKEAAQSGCMMNVVTGDVDRGPVVSYCRYGIQDAANVELWDEARTLGLDAPQTEIEATALYADIRERGVARERPFLVETLRAIAEGKLEVPPAAPADLTGEVEASFTPSQQQEPVEGL